MAKNRLNIILGIDVGGLEKSLKRVQRKLSRFARNVENTGRNLSQSVTLPLAALGGASLAAFADVEKLEKGLKAVLDPTADVGTELNKLREAAKNPGLGFEQAVKGSIQLQAVGFSADAARQTLSELGKVIAITGGAGQELESVTRQLVQMNSKGKILASDFNVIKEQAPAIGLALQEAFGTQNIEQIRASGISAGEFTQKLVEAIPRVQAFQNVTGGLGNAFENLQNSTKAALGELGRTINEVFNVEATLDKLGEAIQGVVNNFKGLTPEAQRAILTFTAVAAAIGPVLLVIGKLISLGPILIQGLTGIISAFKSLGAAVAFATSPIGLIVAAIAAAAAGLVYLYKNSELARRIINGLSNQFLEFLGVLKSSALAIVNVAQGLGNLISFDFGAAVVNFQQAFDKLGDIGKLGGKNMAEKFNTGFADSTDRIESTIEAIKKKIFRQTSDVEAGLGLDVQATDVPGLDVDTPNIKFPDIDAPDVSIKGKIDIDQGFDIPDIDIPEIKVNPEQLEQAVEIMGRLSSSIRAADEKAQVLGSSLGDRLQEKLNLVSGALAETIEKYGANVETVQVLKAQYDELGAALENYNIQQEQAAEKAQLLNQINNIATNAFQSTAEAVGSAIGQILSGASSIGSAFKGAILPLVNALEQMGKLAIQAGITSEAIKSAFNLSGFGAILAGTALIALAKLVKGRLSKAAKLATGGIIPSGFPNDTYPALLTSGETVLPKELPLEKIVNQGSGGGFIAEARISGEDLLILLKRAEANFSRFS